LAWLVGSGNGHPGASIQGEGNTIKPDGIVNQAWDFFAKCTLAGVGCGVAVWSWCFALSVGRA
jgi:hypothetical protein